MDYDFNGKFKLERVKEYLRKRKTMRNITPAIIFSKLIKKKVKINVVVTSQVLLVCLKCMSHYELNYPYKNMLKGLAQAKIIKKSVILFRALNVII